MARVIIPDNADELIGLIELIIAKETAVAPNGVLTPAELTELQDYRQKGADANAAQKQFYKDAEEKTKMRDLALGTHKGATVNQPGSAMYLVTYLRDALLAKNKTNPNVLGEWGFVVDTSPKKKAEPTPTP